MSNHYMKGRLVCNVSWPRSCSRWLARMFIDYFDDAKKISYPAHPLVTLTHVLPTPKDILTYGQDKYVFLVRDPRDSIISSMYLYSSVASHADITELNLYDFIQYYMMGGGGEWGWWNVFIEGWLRLLKEFPDIATVNQEALFADRETELCRLLTEMGHKVDEARFNRAIERSRETKPTMGQNAMRAPYTKEPQWFRAEKTVPAGRSEWQLHFDRKSAKLMHEEFGSLMKELGYIEGDDWWKDLSDKVTEAKGKDK